MKDKHVILDCKCIIETHIYRFLKLLSVVVQYLLILLME